MLWGLSWRQALWDRWPLSMGLDLVPVSEQVQRLNQFAVLRAIIVWPHFY